MNELEAFIGDFVAARLNGVAKARDVAGAPNNTHDFDIDVGHNVVALEVTTAPDAEAIRMWRAISRAELGCDGLARHWHLSLARGTRVRALEKILCGALRELEDAGVDEFEPDRGWDEDEPEHAIEQRLRRVPAVEQLRSSGVRYAHSFHDGSPGLVSTGSSNGYATSPELVVKIVEAEAAKTDNRSKLAKAAGVDRQLFVWIDRDPAAGAMAFPGLPDRLPVLPPEIATAWAATGGRTEDGIVVRRCWRVTPPAGWQEIGLK